MANQPPTNPLLPPINPLLIVVDIVSLYPFLVQPQPVVATTTNRN